MKTRLYLLKKRMQRFWNQSNFMFKEILNFDQRPTRLNLIISLEKIIKHHFSSDFPSMSFIFDNLNIVRDAMIFFGSSVISILSYSFKTLNYIPFSLKDFLFKCWHYIFGSKKKSIHFFYIANPILMVFRNETCVCSMNYSSIFWFQN